MASAQTADRVSDDDLLAALRAASGPSRDLDHAVTLWLGVVDERDWWRANPQHRDAPPWYRFEGARGGDASGRDGRSHVVAAWTRSLDAAVGLVRHVLPGWWWSMGDCSASADSTLGPDRRGPDAGLLELPDRRFDEAFRLDLRGAHVCMSTIENMVVARMARDEALATVRA